MTLRDLVRMTTNLKAIDTGEVELECCRAPCGSPTSSPKRLGLVAMGLT
jgi:hypothetical protein